MERFEAAANLATYLLEKTGSVCGVYGTRMSAQEQRALFGRFIGKGVIVINGLYETISNRVKIAYGADWEDRNIIAWRDL